MKERTIRSGNGNLLKNGVAVGGKLHLTSEYVYHIPHAMNLNKKQTEIALGEISQVHLISHRIFNLIPISNGLEIVLHSGDTMRFVVNKRKRWKREIEQALENGY
ncbi:hypothetical protein ACFOU0_13660 [Salinicoccus sesuvii]|uniref:GRAM domain-containing protein n=1 Tax=Salinicoccus sesuvii TaxID=868281 RepID=A0ABV7NA87_9STAP